MIGPEELREIEPHCTGLKALHAPFTGIIDFGDVARAYARLFAEAGGAIRTSCEVTGMTRSGRGFVIETSRDAVETRTLINCAGLFVDRVAAMTPGFADSAGGGIDEPVRIVPFRGEYHRLQPDKQGLVKGLVYPVPDPQFPFLGVHFTPTVHGRVEVGPNAVLAFARQGYRQSDVNVRDLYEVFSYGGFWAMARRHWKRPRCRSCGARSTSAPSPASSSVSFRRSSPATWCTAAPACAPRRYRPAASWWTTSSSPSPRVLSTCSTRPPRAPLRRWGSRTPSAAPRRNTWNPETPGVPGQVDQERNSARGGT